MWKILILDGSDPFTKVLLLSAREKRVALSFV